jgi:pimeloyl-ACP methyl ester carboxylesterase
MNRSTEKTSQNDESGPEQWRERGELVKLLGHSLFVIDESPHQSAADKTLERPTILLLHGFPTSSWDWQPIWNSLVKDYRLIAVDMLGFGFSDKPNKYKYSIHGQADLVEALVKAKQLKQFHVLTHDYGDTVGQELLARQLEGSGAGEWLSCCFLNGGLFPETHRALLTQKLLLSPIGGLLNRLTGYAKFCRNFSSVFGAKSKPSEEELKNFWWLININNGKHIFHNLITYIRDRLEHRERLVSAMQQSTIPLALINGSVDPVSGKHMVARYQELNCRLDYLAQLSEIGHYPQVEAPAEVAAHYQTFLQQLPEV